MTKAILVLDEMPKNCHGCPCAHSESNICQATNGWVFGSEKEIPCPLKPIPQKFGDELDCPYGFDYMMGWDDCLDELVGDEE